MGRYAEGATPDNKIACVVTLIRSDSLTGAYALTGQHRYSRIPLLLRTRCGHLGLYNEAVPILRQDMTHVSHLGLFTRAFAEQA